MMANRGPDDNNYRSRNGFSGGQGRENYGGSGYNGDSRWRDSRNDFRGGSRTAWRDDRRDGGWRDDRRDGGRDGGWRNDRRDGGRDGGWRDDRRDGGRDGGWRDDRRDGGRDGGWRDDRRDGGRDGGARYGSGDGGRYGNYNGRTRNYNRNSNAPLAPRKPRNEPPIPESNEPIDPETLVSFSGVLETHPNGYGFLRDPKENYDRQLSDPFVPGSLIDKLGLREGILINGLVQPGRKNQGPRLAEIIDIDGMPPNNYLNVKSFEEMTPINPEEWLRLETGPEPISTRVMDILTPLGKGQRALIVAPPRSGKTVLLQQISQAITKNYPNIHVIVLLIDERPEEVTDFRRAVNAEVVASSLDCELENHVRLSQFVIQRCKRLSEMGKDVFLLLDSITRLARAFNKWVGNTGRTMTGGIDVKAMDIPKKIFSSARANEEGGSLTIVGTALVDTGSRMDELIFQEFKGTGNMELALDRRLADRRIWPAIDVSLSGTRREEKLLPPETLRAVNMLRRAITPMNPVEAMEKLTMNLSRCATNAEFFDKFTKYG